MKKLLKHYDIIYIIGLFLFGVGLLSFEVLEGVGVLYVFTIIPAMPFIFVGGFIITGELILTKQYKRLFKYIMINIKTGTTLYVIIGSVIAFIVSGFILTPMHGLIFTFIILLVYITYVLILKSTKLNLAPLTLVVLIIIKLYLKLSGIDNFAHVNSIIQDGVVLIYIVFLIITAIMFLKTDSKYDIKLFAKVISTIVFINIIIFTIQYNVYNTEYFHTQDDIRTHGSDIVHSSSCPTGYGYQTTESRPDEFICIELNTPIVIVRNGGVAYIGFIYLSLIIFSIYYSSIKMDPPKQQLINEKSASSLSDFLDKEKKSEI